ncbi:MAG: large conductance mechanosensitive channel protein MscL [Armatimonadota bacterium]
MLDDFKKFAAAGNVIDLAVGVIVGGMFGKIVTAFVDDLINPILGLVGKADFTNLYIPLSSKIVSAPNGQLPALADARKLGPVLAYGDFITVVINTLLTLFAIFLVVRGINRMRELSKKREAAVVETPIVAEPAPVPADVALLTEIRDLLRAKG